MPAILKIIVVAQDFCQGKSAQWPDTRYAFLSESIRILLTDKPETQNQRFNPLLAGLELLQHLVEQIPTEHGELICRILQKIRQAIIL